MNPYENLANAIIVRAAKDYRVILKRCLRHPQNEEWQKEREKLERFFMSEWYLMLTVLDSKILIKKIREEVNYDNKRILRSGIQA